MKNERELTRERMYPHFGGERISEESLQSVSAHCDSSFARKGEIPKLTQKNLIA